MPFACQPRAYEKDVKRSLERPGLPVVEVDSGGEQRIMRAFQGALHMGIAIEMRALGRGDLPRGRTSMQGHGQGS